MFLASDEAAWITGTVLRVDGGLLAGNYRMTGSCWLRREAKSWTPNQIGLRHPHRGGDVVDRKWFTRIERLDVGIVDGRLAASTASRARREADHRCERPDRRPGFIDVHVHSELARLGGVDQFAGVLDGVTTS